MIDLDYFYERVRDNEPLLIEEKINELKRLKKIKKDVRTEEQQKELDSLINSLNWINEDGNKHTPLTLASTFSHLKLSLLKELLWTFETVINKKNGNGSNALHVACDHGIPSYIETLLKVNEEDYPGEHKLKISELDASSRPAMYYLTLKDKIDQGNGIDYPECMRIMLYYCTLADITVNVNENTNGLFKNSIWLGNFQALWLLLKKYDEFPTETSTKQQFYKKLGKYFYQVTTENPDPTKISKMTDSQKQNIKKTLDLYNCCGSCPVPPTSESAGGRKKRTIRKKTKRSKKTKRRR
jgi:hypothetical protein